MRTFYTSLCIQIVRTLAESHGNNVNSLGRISRKYIRNFESFSSRQRQRDAFASSDPRLATNVHLINNEIRVAQQVAWGGVKNVECPAKTIRATVSRESEWRGGMTETGNLRVTAIILPPRYAESSRGDNKGLRMLLIQFRRPRRRSAPLRDDQWALRSGCAKIDMSLAWRVVRLVYLPSIRSTLQFRLKEEEKKREISPLYVQFFN